MMRGLGGVLAAAFLLLPVAAEAGRSQLQRDVEGYATATCLGQQPSDYLKDQADAWGSIIVERSHGDIEVLTAVGKVVKAEMARRPMAMVHDESAPMSSKPAPVFYCAEIIDAPSVHAAIVKAMARLRPEYRRRR